MFFFPPPLHFCSTSLSPPPLPISLPSLLSILGIRIKHRPSESITLHDCLSTSLSCHLSLTQTLKRGNFLGAEQPRETTFAVQPCICTAVITVRSLSAYRCSDRCSFKVYVPFNLSISQSIHLCVYVYFLDSAYSSFNLSIHLSNDLLI